MYKIVPITTEHLPDIFQWFDYYGYNENIKDCLSDTGFLCYKDDIMCAAGWVYLPLNHKWVFYENLVANPFINSRDKLIATDKVIDAGIYFASELGYKYHSVAVGKRIGKRMESKGFQNSFTNFYTKTLH